MQGAGEGERGRLRDGVSTRVRVGGLGEGEACVEGRGDGDGFMWIHASHTCGSTCAATLYYTRTTILQLYCTCNSHTCAPLMFRACPAHLTHTCTTYVLYLQVCTAAV